MKKKLTDEKLKREFDSPRRRLKSSLIGLTCLAIGMAVFAVLVNDPLNWFKGPLAVREAMKSLIISIVFVCTPSVASVWFLVIRPLQTGVLTGRGYTYRPYLVFRSKEPARFLANYLSNCLCVTLALAFSVSSIVHFLHHLEKARNSAPNGHRDITTTNVR